MARVGARIVASFGKRRYLAEVDRALLTLHVANEPRQRLARLHARGRLGGAATMITLLSTGDLTTRGMLQMTDELLCDLVKRARPGRLAGGRTPWTLAEKLLARGRVTIGQAERLHELQSQLPPSLSAQMADLVSQLWHRSGQPPLVDGEFEGLVAATLNPEAPPSFHRRVDLLHQNGVIGERTAGELRRAHAGGDVGKAEELARLLASGGLTEDGYDQLGGIASRDLNTFVGRAGRVAGEPSGNPEDEWLSLVAKGHLSMEHARRLLQLEAQGSLPSAHARFLRDRVAAEGQCPPPLLAMTDRQVVQSVTAWHRNRASIGVLKHDSARGHYDSRPVASAQVRGRTGHAHVASPDAAHRLTT